MHSNFVGHQILFINLCSKMWWLTLWTGIVMNLMRVNRYVLANMNAGNTRYILILLVVKIIHLWGNTLKCDDWAWDDEEKWRQLKMCCMWQIWMLVYKIYFIEWAPRWRLEKVEDHSKQLCTEPYMKSVAEYNIQDSKTDGTTGGHVISNYTLWVRDVRQFKNQSRLPPQKCCSFKSKF